MNNHSISVEAIADSLPGMVAYWDKHLICRYANKPYKEWFGKNANVIHGMTLQELLGDRLFKLNEPFVRAALMGDKQNFERTLTKADGSIGFTWANYIPDIDESGNVLGFYVLVTDITQLRKSESDLKIAATVFANTLDAIVATDLGRKILSVNPAFTEITQYTSDEAVGKSLSLLRASAHENEFFDNLWSSVNERGRWEGEVWTRRKNGEAFLSFTTIIKVNQIADDNVKYMHFFHDITNLRRDDNKLKHLAFHDALTNLPNRTLLIDRLEQLIMHSERENQSITVLFLDLDGFKLVNDVHGHDAGDLLLRKVAVKLQSLVRQSDTVARIGGDEFVILLDHIHSNASIKDLCSRIIQVINEPANIFNEMLQVGVSIGISNYPSNGKTVSELIKNADIAMYASKRAGKNTFSFFSSQNALAR
jgi:diguanylate cyclase (GGDEF)-like protein/PAS domain S-box-containing protein